MKVRFLRGTTEENNSLTLPAGEIAIDTEKHVALRRRICLQTMVGAPAYV